jgi:hypothetical protein
MDFLESKVNFGNGGCLRLAQESMQDDVGKEDWLQMRSPEESWVFLWKKGH